MTVFLFWLHAVGCLLATARWATGGPRSRRLLLGLTALVVVAGWSVSGRLVSAWIDACDFGGSGYRCIGGSGSVPDTVVAVWPLSGALIGGLCGPGCDRTARNPVLAAIRNCPLTANSRSTVASPQGGGG